MRKLEQLTKEHIERAYQAQLAMAKKEHGNDASLDFFCYMNGEDLAFIPSEKRFCLIGKDAWIYSNPWYSYDHFKVSS